MQKTILITGATDGIGLATAKLLLSRGHHILLHGRNQAKLDNVLTALAELSSESNVEGYLADLSRIQDVKALAKSISDNHNKLDVLINNAGIFKVPNPITESGLDARFVVNTIAPYLLTQLLTPMMGVTGRVVNLSSAAQAPVDIGALTGKVRLSDMDAYAQSKLALTMWSRTMGLALKNSGPAIIAVNPGSLLGSKMVKEGFGVAGGDISIGADILARAALSEDFADATGKYFDNDSGQFASPQADGLDEQKSEKLIQAIESMLS